MIRELDVVALKHDIEEENLKKGDTGTVVHCHRDGKAFLVEFIDTGGTTTAVITLTDHDIRMVEHPTREVG